jgi:hypothetical protein
VAFVINRRQDSPYLFLHTNFSTIVIWQLAVAHVTPFLNCRFGTYMSILNYERFVTNGACIQPIAPYQCDPVVSCKIAE